MKRIPFNQVELELNKLYDFSITSDSQINKRCELIQNFVEACGWEIEDYIREMFKEYFSPINN